MAQRQVHDYVRDVCTACGAIAYRNPAPASGCIVEHRSQVLLARRKFAPWQGFWYVPSGFVEYGEDVEDTARREILEETGLVVEIERLFGVYSYFDDPRQHGIIILYKARVIGGTLQAGDDASDVAFFDADALPAPDQIGFASHRRALQQWRESISTRASPLTEPNQMVTSAASGPSVSNA